MRWLNSQTLSSPPLMPHARQAICGTVCGPRCSPGWRANGLSHTPSASRHCHRTCCARLAARTPSSGESGRREPGAYLLWLRPSLPVSPCRMLLASAVIISAAISTSHLLLSLAGSRNHHLGVRTHSRLNWTPLVNYAALTREKETVYSPLQVGAK